MNLIILIVFILQTALSVVLGTFFGDSLSDYMQVYLTQIIPIFHTCNDLLFYEPRRFQRFLRVTRVRRR
ncbi:MAG: hypothetical protein L6V93_07335 [Clostridiales bacterium]|nr:MAG: hypothetical protein L6V93_07335 [Clostridiales bacterium]